MLVGSVVYKSTTITKFLILCVYNIRRRDHEFHDESFLDKCLVTNCTSGYVTGEKNFARNAFVSLIAKTGQRKNIMLYVSSASMISL